MSKLAAAGLIVVAMLACAGVRPAAAQTAVGCAPYCDFSHYYGTYDYTYERPGLFCSPVCGPDGNCIPAKTCVSSAIRGRVLVRSLAGPGVAAPVAIAAPANPTSVIFYDPTLASPAPPPRAARRARLRR